MEFIGGVGCGPRANELVCDTDQGTFLKDSFFIIVICDSYRQPRITRNPHAIASIKPRDAAQPQSVRRS